MASLEEDQRKQSWNEDYENDDLYKDQKAFLSTLTALRGQNCPLRKHGNKHKNEDKPWITMGIENICKNKYKIH